MAVRCPGAAARVGTTPSLATVLTTVRRRHKRVPISVGKDSISPLRTPQGSHAPQRLMYIPESQAYQSRWATISSRMSAWFILIFTHQIFFDKRSQINVCPLGPGWSMMPMRDGPTMQYTAGWDWVQPTPAQGDLSYLSVTGKRRVFVRDKIPYEVASSGECVAMTKGVNRKGASPRVLFPTRISVQSGFLFKMLCVF